MRSAALAAAAAWFDAGGLLAELRKPRRHSAPKARIAERAPALARYLTEEIGPATRAAGLSHGDLGQPGCAARRRCCFAERIEGPAAAHGADLRTRRRRSGLRQPVGQAAGRPGRSRPTAIAGIGRGTADNKGQHTINIAALGQVLAARGRLGFNAKLLLEMGEEVGSPGLREICETRAPALRSDVLIASDGPRLAIGSARRSSSARAARSISISSSICATARTIRETGAACSPIRASCSPTRSHRWSTRADGFWSQALRRRPCPLRCGARSPTSSPASRTGPPSTPTGASRIDAGRARLRLELARSARVSHRQSRPSGQRDSAARHRASAGALSSPVATGAAFVPAMRTHLDLNGFAEGRSPRRRTRNR